MSEMLKLLCVDDEPRVVRGLERHLAERYAVLTANSGKEGLALLESHADVAIVISDMRMPEMDGATFLRHARAQSPNAVRLLLTGHADIQSAISAINKGQVFRFMTKPCPPEELAATLLEAEQQYQLVMAERTLLQRTLVGALKVLVETMSWSNPDAMGRAVRLRRRVVRMADALHVERRWMVETAALLSEIATLSLPPETAQKLNQGVELSVPEQEKLAGARRAAHRLIAQIPRLEPVSVLMDATFRCGKLLNGASALSAADARLVQLLRLAVELESKAEPDTPADYTAEMLEAARSTETGEAGVTERQTVATKALQTGMVLDEDITTQRGVLIAPRGIEVTTSFLQHIASFLDRLSKPEIRVIVPLVATAGEAFAPPA
jgi:CheY-like chemotaxis protein